MDLAYAVPLREALQAADYTYDAVVETLGAEGHAALSRNETTPGERATRGGSPRETLTRLFLLQLAVPASQADAALPGLVDRLCAAGLLTRSVGEVAARVDVRPYATEHDDLWVSSDLTPGLDGAAHRMAADHVLGISSASSTLAALTVREQVSSALDLGTGCGVQALHLAEHVDRVVATDVNARALWLTRLNAVLNDVDLDVREGDFFAPVRGERFDLITTNPPFVISPATGERLVYRDSGLPGDRVVEHVVRHAIDHLVEGGIAQVLGNWMVLRDRPWEERLGAWVVEADAWVVQRELVDLPTYVELWLKDAGLHGTAEYTRRYDTWLSWFDDQGAEAVGFGWLNLRRTASPPRIRCEDWPYEVQLPLGEEVAAHFGRLDLLDTDLAGLRLVRAPDVVQETLGLPGAEDPQRIVLRRQTGVRRARPVDTGEAALVGACDGDLTIGQILAALEELVGPADRMPAVRELVADGFLTATAR
ncbi:methyltransferase domain-containing protein [Nocardioides mangrovicus]|uniref:Methyltransferase domain-containing protein n=1 Tax=Nocardioides mangrovicus TaxID=2478913 RepID=A0A3L8P1J0_9ACTN|nr:methyltransferase [Nocardioides mangrovicus]RLV48288.1 methyltransferase domain-containing protein [Nocardioides mangrovicus]